MSAKYDTLILPTIEQSDHLSSEKLSLADIEACYSELPMSSRSFSMHESSQKLS